MHFALIVMLAQDTQPSLYSGPWTPMLITALFAGIIGVIGAVVAGVVKIVTMLATNRREAAEAAAKQDEKIGDVKVLVNHTQDKLMQEIASLREKNTQQNQQALAETAALRATIANLNITAARAEGVAAGKGSESMPTPAAPTPVVVVNTPAVPVPTVVVGEKQP